MMCCRAAAGRDDVLPRLCGGALWPGPHRKRYYILEQFILFFFFKSNSLTRCVSLVPYKNSILLYTVGQNILPNF